MTKREGVVNLMINEQKYFAPMLLAWLETSGLGYKAIKAK